MRNSYAYVLIILAVAIATVSADAPVDPVEDPQSGVTPDPEPRYGRLTGIVDFESLDLAPGTQIDLDDGESLIVDGFVFTPGPNNHSGLNDSHYSNAATFWGYNGTHVAAYHDDVVMTFDGGGTFNLFSFDFCGWPVNAEVSFTVTGQPGNIVAMFTPDGLVDGPGGVEDFETFVLPHTFRDLMSVTFEHFGQGTNGGTFELDNIRADGTVPVEEKTWGAVKEPYRAP